MKRVALMLVLVVAMLTPNSPASAQAGDPAAVVDAYTAAINAGNAEAALAFVADEAVYMRPAGQFIGKDQVRAFVEGLIARNAQIELLGEREVFGDYVRWMSRVTFTNPDGSSAEIRNRSQSIVHEGKIVFHMASPAQ